MALPTGLYGPATRVPAIPDTRSAKPQDVAQAMKEWIEVREGVRGDGMDKAVTVRDLLNSGLATPFDLRNLQVPGMPSNPGGNPGTDPDIPPTPENLVASGAFKYIILTWDFARGYSRLAYFEVWRSVTDVIGDAVLLAQPFGTIFADDVGAGKTYYYWVRAVSNAPAMSPFSSLTGTLGQTSLEAAYLIELLIGQIGPSQLNEALSDTISLIEASADTPNSVAARIKSETDARTSAIGAEATARTTQLAQYDQNIKAFIVQNTYSAADANQAIATAVNQVTARLNNVGGASIEQNFTSQANVNGTLSAQMTVKTDVNGYVAGYGFANTLVGSTPVSSFIIRSDSFAIASPTGPGIAPAFPFIVRTTVSVINGVTVPIGTYMQDAFIANGSISNAKIGNLQVDDAKIANLSVAKLRAGAISVSEYIESSNYAGGQSGWRIHGNGDPEFRNGIFRGTVYATAGLIGGNVLADKSITTSKLQVGSFDNVVPDADMMDPVFWGSSPNEFIAYPNTFWHSARVLSIGAQARTDRFTPMFSIAAGATYLFEYQMFLSGDFVGNISVVAHLPGQDWFDMGGPSRGYAWAPEQGGLLVNYDGNSLKGITENRASTQVHSTAQGAQPDGSNSSGKMQFRIIAQCFSGYWQVGGFRVTRMSDNVLIADGAVTARTVGAREITAEKLLVNELSAVSRNIGVLDNGIVSGQRSILDANGIRVYDQNNTLRVELGLW